MMDDYYLDEPWQPPDSSCPVCESWGFSASEKTGECQCLVCDFKWNCYGSRTRLAYDIEHYRDIMKIKVMYPFIITWEKNYFDWLNVVDQYGYHHDFLTFWFPTMRIDFATKGTNFVTDEPSYPDITAPWNRVDRTNDSDWDCIPF
jgi:hypothetical protein